MTLRQKLDQSYELFVEKVHEPGINSFCIEVCEGIPASKPEKLVLSNIDLGQATSIDVTQDANRFRILFDDYVSYVVLNESFSSAPLAHEVYSGNRFREYTCSTFLEHIKSTTYACDDYPGKLRHFEIVCADHIIGVISQNAPEISLVAA